MNRGPCLAGAGSWMGDARARRWPEVDRQQCCEQCRNEHAVWNEQRRGITAAVSGVHGPDLGDYQERRRGPLVDRSAVYSSTGREHRQVSGTIPGTVPLPRQFGVPLATAQLGERDLWLRLVPHQLQHIVIAEIHTVVAIDHSSPGLIPIPWCGWDSTATGRFGVFVACAPRGELRNSAPSSDRAALSGC